MSRLAILLVLFSIPLYFRAENIHDFAIEEYITTIDECNDDEALCEVDEEIVEKLQFGINLNNITAEEFADLRLFTPQTIRAIIAYRNAFKGFASIYELKNIDEVSEKELHLLMQLAYVPPPKEKKKSSPTSSGESFTLFSRNMNADNSYLGDNNKFIQKLSYSLQGRLNIGLMAEKDEGELYHNDWRPLDHSAGFVEFCNAGAFRKILVGDYRLHYGSGLILGKSYITKTNPFSYADGIKHFNSTVEYGYFRGLAMSVKLNHIEIAPFISYHKLDATLKDSASFSSFYTAGYHRTSNELSKRRTIDELFCGAHAKYSFNKLSLGATYTYWSYSKLLSPNPTRSNCILPSDIDSGYNFSFDYSFVSSSIQCKGEIAKSSVGGIAAINQLSFVRRDFIRADVSYRYYSANYFAPYAQAIRENARVMNEKGMLTSLSISPLRKLTLNLCMDLFAFNNERLRRVGMCKGYEFISQLNYKVTKRQNIMLRFRTKSKERDISGEYLPTITNQLRLRHIFNPTEHFLLQTSLLGKSFQMSKNVKSRGFLANETLRWIFLHKRLNFDVIYSYFNAADYDSRIYFYESDVQGYYTSFIGYGCGHHAGFLASYCIGDRISIYAKYASTLYSNASQKKRNDIKLALRIKW